ncbi:voltage-gated chloride channel family protein [Reichenbachiella versicolor]|uniref:voltage-gated chloride channel family protein n=1 Tax=Reichenbachiella versicolor TaxID=1821036 RepID=UPI000D6DC642|nr:voltage-gated chloride channel family protein [Reichenbachiella versicolor]
MTQSNFPSEQIQIGKHLFKWILLVLPVSIIVGSLVALFLWLMEWAATIRWNNQWIIYFLPFAGIAIYIMYRFFGKNSAAGNNLIMDEIHKPGGGIPFRMAPLVLISTVITHLFGGSAGREGTAVQIGGSIAAFVGKTLKLNNEDTKIILLSGMAAGFGAVFGTPVTGAIFALEVLAIGRIKYNALLPCLAASLLADITCTAFPIHHTHYTIEYSAKETFNSISFIHFDLKLLSIVIGASVLFGLASFLFSKLSHGIKDLSSKLIPSPWLIPVIGAGLVIGISYSLGTFDYLGLGVNTINGDGISIINAFKVDGVDQLSWFWKLILTAITLGMGFKGGEVTPLFFIGATLGNAIAFWTGAPVDLMAGLGFIAVFAGATNTPLACTIMGIELFGAENITYYAVACFTAYYFSGHSGIYSSQRIAISKTHKEQTVEKTLGD